MRESEFNEWMASRDVEIRIGSIAKVRDQLLRRIEIRLREAIPRQQIAPLASLCRRTGLYFESTLLLHRYLRPEPYETVRPTPEEKVEYAGALAQMGDETEALEILNGIQPGESASALFFSAFARFARWEYEATIPLLEQFISHRSIT